MITVSKAIKGATGIGLAALLVTSLAIPAATGATPLSSPAPPSVSTPNCTIIGTARADVISGTNSRDVICGLGGDDTIRGLGGNDVILGGAGNDRLIGGDGRDDIRGDAGRDNLSGDAGDDRLDGGAGNDVVAGGIGADVLAGGTDSDTLSGGAGNDSLVGGPARDTLDSGAGSDSCAVDTGDIRLDECRTDSQPPVISFPASMSPNVAAGQTVSFRWNVADPSGVNITWASIGGLPGWVTEWCGFGVVGERVEGSDFSGVYQLNCGIPALAVNGGYTLFIGATDSLGNGTVNQGQFNFTVTGGSADNQAPVVAAVRAPSAVPQNDTITVELDLTDETGVAGAYAWLLGPNGFAGPQGLYAVASGEAQLISGTSQAGTSSQAIAFAPFAPLGVYSVWLSVRDSLGNRVFIDTGERITLVSSTENPLPPPTEPAPTPSLP